MALLNQLNSLETAGLIRLATVQPELEYLFRHALVQDAAYGSLLKNDRKRLHKHAGEALEQLYPTRLDEIASTLAYHFEKANEHDKAIRYFMLAGDRARASYANSEAIQFYQAALVEIEAVGEREALRCQLYEVLGDLLILLGQRAAGREYFTCAIAQLTAPLAQARLHRKIATSLVDERYLSEAEKNFAEGEALLQHTPLETPEWRQELIQNQLDRFWMYYIQHRIPEIESLVQQLQPWIEANGTPSQRARFSIGVTQINLRRYRYAVTPEQLAIQRRGLEAAQAADDPNLLAELHFTYGFLLLWHGSWPEAEAELAAAVTLCKQTGNVTILARTLSYMVILHRLRKDGPKLQALLPELSQVLQAAGLKEYLPYISASEAWLAWQANRFDEAEKKAQESLADFQRNDIKIPFQWLAHWPLLDIAFQQKNYPAAIEQAKEMLEPIQQKLPDDVTAALEAAINAGETGQFDAARQPLTEALKLATAKGYL